jgi:hypothetical protein
VKGIKIDMEAFAAAVPSLLAWLWHVRMKGFLHRWAHCP